jgi:hypothetical protein
MDKDTNVTEALRNKVSAPIYADKSKMRETMLYIAKVTPEILHGLGYEYDGVTWTKGDKCVADYSDGYYVYTGNLTKRGKKLKTVWELEEYTNDTTTVFPDDFK